MAKLALTIGIISILILATFAFRSEPSFDRLAGRVERARMLPEESRAELQKLLERIRATAPPSSPNAMTAARIDRANVKLQTR